MRQRIYGLIAASCILMTSITGYWLLITVTRGTESHMTSPPSVASEVSTSSTSSTTSKNSAVPIPNSPAKLVELGYVKYTGMHDKAKGINFYRGIQYAIPPTGQYRWKPPRSVESENVFNGEEIVADTPGPSCYQVCLQEMTCESSYQSENCLYLNIIVPDQPVSSRLPVVVMIRKHSQLIP